jgi:hypothetical protein
VRFFTGKPCPRGHISERLVSNRQCITCGRIKNRQRDKKRLKRPATPPASRTPGSPLKDPRQEAFCQGVAKGLHKYEAYQQAGYKGGRVAARNFPHSKRPNVRKHLQGRIDELIAEAAGKAQITIDKDSRNAARSATSIASRSCFPRKTTTRSHGSGGRSSNQRMQNGSSIGSGTDEEATNCPTAIGSRLHRLRCTRAASRTGFC